MDGVVANAQISKNPIVIDPQKPPEQAAKVAQENTKYLKKLKGRKPKKLYAMMTKLHHETFKKNRLPKLRQLLQNHRTPLFAIGHQAYQ